MLLFVDCITAKLASIAIPASTGNLGALQCLLMVVATVDQTTATTTTLLNLDTFVRIDTYHRGLVNLLRVCIEVVSLSIAGNTLQRNKLLGLRGN